MFRLASRVGPACVPALIVGASAVGCPTADPDASDAGQSVSQALDSASASGSKPEVSAPAADPVADPWAATGLQRLRNGPNLTWPIESVHITSTFGWRVDPVLGSGVRLHRGVDFRGDVGDLVLSIAAGTVEFAGHDPSLGNMVIVDHGLGVSSLYGHLSDLLVHSGSALARGAALGLVGNTGRSAAPHLHLTIKIDNVAVDPLLLLGQPLHRAAALQPTPPSTLAPASAPVKEPGSAGESSPTPPATKPAIPQP